MKSLFTHCDLALSLFKILFFPFCMVELSALTASYHDVSVKYIFVRPFPLFLFPSVVSDVVVFKITIPPSWFNGRAV